MILRRLHNWLLALIMAITFLNAGAEGSAASGNITLGAPASPQTNDVWIAVVHSTDQVAHSFADWTQIYQGNGGGTTSRLSVWYFRYAGSTPNLVVTHAAGQSPIGGISAFRGCKAASSPVNVTGSGGAGTDASIELTEITTTKDGCMILACDGSADDNNRSTLPTGFTACFEDTAGGTQSCYQTTAGNPDGSVACHRLLQASQGPTGALTDTQAAGDAWASVLLALEPAGTLHELAGAAASSSSGVGSLLKTSSLAGNSTATSSGVGALGQLKQLGGASVSSSSGVANLGLLQPIAGAAVGISSGVGGAQLALGLNGSTLSQSSGVGVLLQTAALSGSAPGSSSGVGALVKTASLAGEAVASSSGVGSLGLLAPLSGQSSGLSSGQAALQLIKLLEGSTLSQASGTGALAILHSMAGAALAVSSGQGTLAAIRALGGITSGTSSGVGDLGLVSGGGTVHQLAGMAFGSSSGTAIFVCPCTVQFTNEFFTGVIESWALTTEIADSSGVMNFVQPDYRVPPVVILVPLDASMALNRIHVADVTATGVTIGQTPGIGPGRARVLVARREGLWKRLGS